MVSAGPSTSISTTEMADPNDKRLWVCDKCGTETVGSEESIFADDIMAWYRHEGEGDNGYWQLILCGFCQPLQEVVEK